MRLIRVTWREHENKQSEGTSQLGKMDTTTLTLQHHDDIESQRYKRLQQHQHPPYQRVSFLVPHCISYRFASCMPLEFSLIRFPFQRNSFLFILVFIMFFALMRIIIWFYQYNYTKTVEQQLGVRNDGSTEPDKVLLAT